MMQQYCSMFVFGSTAFHVGVVNFCECIYVAARL